MPQDANRDLEAIYPQAYEQLCAMARKQLAGEHALRTLDTVGLVNEVYLKMVAQEKKAFVNEGQFFALAARSMRRILIDYARRQQRQKRGGQQLHLTLDEAVAGYAITADEVLALDEALQRYAELSERGARIIELWFFAGFKQEEIANILEVSSVTVRREWRLARAWLNREVKRLAG